MRNGLTRKWREWRRRLSGRVDVLTRRFSQKDLPIPLAGIAECCKVKETIFRPLLVEGGLAIDDDGFIIYVRSEETGIERLTKAYREPKDQGRTLPARTRFTLAHEIAHTFFFDTRNGSPRAVVTGSDQLELRNLEFECNQAAAKLLMPDYLLKKIIKTEHIDLFKPDEVLCLTRRFGVSLQALVRRIRTLDYWSSEHGGVFYVRQVSRRPVVCASAMTGLARGLFPSARVGVDVREVFYHPDLVVYGGGRWQLDTDVPCKVGAGYETKPWKIACARVSQRYNDFLVSIRFLE